MKKKLLIFFIAVAYAAVMSVLTFTLDKPGLIFLGGLAVMAAVLCSIGWEDYKTLKVSWAKTGIYAILCIPLVIFGIKGGLYQACPLWAYLIDAAFVIVMIIYSLRSGRAGADRDIGFITAVAVPILAALPIALSLIISVVFTAVKKEKFPFLLPFAIMFAMLAVAMIIDVLRLSGWIPL